MLYMASMLVSCNCPICVVDRPAAKLPTSCSVLFVQELRVEPWICKVDAFEESVCEEVVFNL